MSLSEEYFYSCHCFPLSWRRLWMNELSGSQLRRRAHISASVQTSFPWAKDWKCMLASLFLSLRYKSQKCMRPNVKSFIYTMLSDSLPVAPCLCSDLKECSRWNECMCGVMLITFFVLFFEIKANIDSRALDQTGILHLKPEMRNLELFSEIPFVIWTVLLSTENHPSGGSGTWTSGDATQKCLWII